MKGQLEQRLRANMLMDACARCDAVIFRDAWCSQDRVIRFATPFFREWFSVEENETGKWNTGDFVMYEVNNEVGSFGVRCVFCPSGAPADAEKQLLDVAEDIETDGAEIVLKRWDYSALRDTNAFLKEFEIFLHTGFSRFEQELHEKAERRDDALREGKSETVTSNKYERNAKARAACLAAHGTACAVCGIDFEKDYGPEFAGKIEVHHVVPLSAIGREYVVDPVRDLIPVCPNCHTALHSKKGGTYTVEELKSIRNRK